jgi:hypothetical protein
MRIARTLWWEKGGTPRHGSPKSGKGREIRLTDRAVEAHKRHRVQQNEQRLAMCSAWVDSGLVFTTRIGTPLRRDTVYRRHFQPLLAKAALPPVTPGRGAQRTGADAPVGGGRLQRVRGGAVHGGKRPPHRAGPSYLSAVQVLRSRCRTGRSLGTKRGTSSQ